MGSGRTEVGEALFGIDPLLSGRVAMGGHQINLKDVPSALGKGIAYVSEDRKGLGLHQDLSVLENFALPSLPTFGNPFLKLKEITEAFGKWTTRLGIKVGSPVQPVKQLSGGNQQKVVLAKWLETHPKVLILDEPTRGIDVNSKREIYRIVRDLSASGLSVILISSEMQELIGLCDRVCVMRHGKISGTLEGTQITEENMIRLASGVSGELN